MAIEGVDVSNHQATFDFRGWQFAIIKSSEGNSFKDFRFWQHVNAARAGGLMVAAYHYQRNVSAQSQYDLIRSVVPTSIPVIIDVEDGSGPLAITRELIDLLRGDGYRVPLLYLPRWYWQNLGRPSLNGLPPLWGSDYRGGSADWSNYGGLGVVLKQYTSTPFDKNRFEGSREEFAALLLGGEEEMSESTVRNGNAGWLKEDLAPGTDQRELLKDLIAEVPVTIREDDGSEREDALGPVLGAVDRRLVRVENAVEKLVELVAKVQLGGVSKEEIAKIAKDAVGADLRNDEE